MINRPMFRQFNGFLSAENVICCAKHCLRLVMFFAILWAVYFLQSGAENPLHAKVKTVSPCSACPAATSNCNIRDCR